MRLAEFVDLLRKADQFERIRLDINAQFGREGDELYGATLLPEVLKPQNAYKEEQVRYQTTLANAGSSYSPAQKSTGGRIFGTTFVSFGNTNISDQIIGPELDILMKLVGMADSTNPNATVAAGAQILKFFDRSIREPMLKLNELYRWQAIIDGVVKRRGSNGYTEDVVYPTPSGHRVAISGGTVAAPDGWYGKSATAYDPYMDFIGAQRFLKAKGYTISRIVSNFSAAFAFQSHPAVINRLGGTTFVNATGQVGRFTSAIDMAKVQAGLNANMLPQWDIYDKTYTTRDPSQTAENSIITNRFLDRFFTTGGGAVVKQHPVVLVCKTGRDESLIDFGDRSSLPNGGITLTDTLGYYGIGTVSGMAGPGRKSHEEVEEKHPGGLWAEMIQEGLPVITEPEAIFVMNVREPTP